MKIIYRNQKGAPFRGNRDGVWGHQGGSSERRGNEDRAARGSKGAWRDNKPFRSGPVSPWGDEKEPREDRGNQGLARGDMGNQGPARGGRGNQGREENGREATQDLYSKETGKD